MSQLLEPAPFIFQHRIKCLIRGQDCTSAPLTSKDTIEDKLQERLFGIMCKIISQSAGYECHLGCDAVWSGRNLPKLPSSSWKAGLSVMLVSITR